MREFAEDAPQTAQQAAEQLHYLGGELDDRRRKALRFRAAKDDAEGIYRREVAVRIVTVEGSNKEERDGRVKGAPLSDGVQREAAAVAERLGLSGWVPKTVGELRWLRDRADGIAEATSAAAYDVRARLKSWTVVAGWGRAEWEDTTRMRHEVQAGAESDGGRR